MSSAPTVVTPENLLRPEVLALHAYHVPPARGEINRYPDAAARDLKERIAKVTNLPAGMEVLLGNGSDEIIQLLVMAVAKPGAVLLSVEPSFVMYRMIATFVGMRYVGVPLAEDFSLDLAATLDAIKREQPALVHPAQN